MEHPVTVPNCVAQSWYLHISNLLCSLHQASPSLTGGPKPELARHLVEARRDEWASLLIL